MNRTTRGMVPAAVLLVLLWLPAWAAADDAGAPATVSEAREFIEKAEARLLELSVKASRAAWVQATFITDDTELLAAEANKDFIAAVMELAGEAKRFDSLKLPDELARKFLLLKLSVSLPAPSDPAKQKELTEAVAWMESTYGKGRYCPPGESEKCLDLNALSRILAESRKPEELLEAWGGWHAIAPAMRERYQRFVVLSNEGARELGFADSGALWRANYDMSPEELSAEVERLWQQLRPFYVALHAYVRASLAKQYGAELVPEKGSIPAHLLGNMWAQTWSNIYPLVAPPKGDTGYDLTELLKAKKVDAKEMVRYGERFFLSLGFEALPASFWERSLFTKPADRDVVCHASAWDVDAEVDLRIKMCIEINDEDFSTVHHELGHNFYQRAYRQQPLFFRGSANDGFHEAVGDTIALSVTPEYLVKIGLLDRAPDASGDLGLLMRMALDKIAFLPFALVVDQWRWKVFSGEVPPARYNQAWWELRRKYQGVDAPLPRSEADFDPGAKYHVAANVPYMRYFLAHVLQFQFHRALCRAAGYSGPLHRCSIYDNKAAGEKLRQMLEMGQSRPWPAALEALTGEKRMDATAILDYFAPLMKWLEEQNRGRRVGW
ncbi:MAG: M2 family metallopeptidase [Candidatus Acidiferrales bacterium]